MKDKDKLILLFNIDVSNIDDTNVNDFLGRTIRAFSNYFDESVKCVFTATRDSSKPTVQAVTQFPVEGTTLLDDLIKYYENGEEEKLAEQVDAIKALIKEFKKDGK